MNFKKLQMIPINEMTREQLLEYSKHLEDRINRWSELEWLIVEVYVNKLKKVDEILLEMYTNDTIEKGA